MKIGAGMVDRVTRDGCTMNDEFGNRRECLLMDDESR